MSGLWGCSGLEMRPPGDLSGPGRESVLLKYEQEESETLAGSDTGGGEWKDAGALWVKESKVKAVEDDEGEVLDGSAVRVTGLTVLTRWLRTAAGLEGRISVEEGTPADGDKGIPADGPQGSRLAALPSPTPPFPL